MDDWPFEQPPNCAVISICPIVFEAAPILHVTCDDHGWQFLGLEDARMEDACVVSLAKLLRLDPSIRDLAGLPPGWQAWRRAAGAPWTREPDPSRVEDG
jgi:hypothetical protein